jgi:DNA-binding NarL/FixJ family response regulator
MKKPAKIRLIVVDDHIVMRMGLVTAASDQPDMEVVAGVESGEEAIEAYRVHQPDVVVLDLRMSGLGGIGTIRALRAEFPAARIVIFSNYARGEEVYQALRAGASGFVVKEMKLETLLQAIRAVHAGQRFIPPEIAVRLSERVLTQLSDRETDVLTLMAKGRSNKEIAAQLHVAEATIKVHVTNILTKLEVTARTEAVVVAVKRGIIDLE